MKNHLLPIAALSLCLFAGQQAWATDYYVSPDGTGRGRSLNDPSGDIKAAIERLQAGDKLYVRGGTYQLSTSISVKNTGTKDKRICVFAYNDEKPVLDFSGQNHDDETTAKTLRGIVHNIGANYWHYRGLEIYNAADNGMKLEGSFCVVERCVFHGCGDTGLQQGFGKGDNGENTRNQQFLYGRYNIIVNCDSYNNCDKWSNGGDADGFAIKLFPGPGNEFHGCRAWYNSDDAWDLYYTVFPILVDNCWALQSGYKQGNGNGFKMGGCKQGGTSTGAHVFKNCIAAFNKSKGYDQNHHLEGSYLINDLAFENNVNYGYNMEEPTYGNWVLRNCVGFKPTERNHQFTKCPDAKNCSWLIIDNLSPLSDRASSDGVTSTVYQKYGSASAWPDYSTEYEDLTYATATSARGANGELPQKFGRLKATSQFIDKGVAISNFQTVDVHKADYEYATNAPQNYSMTLTIPYVGNAPDLGPYEYGGNDNAYTLVFPVNDGTVEDAVPEVSDGKEWDERVLVNNYLFQDATIASDVSKYITATSGNLVVKPLYNGKIKGGGEYSYPDGPGDKYGTGTSYGAYRVPQTAWVEFTLPNVAAFKSNIYCTGGRTLDVIWHYKDSQETKTVSKGLSTGTVLVDVAAMIGKVEKKPIVVRLSNKENGDMFLTDLTLSSYEEVHMGLERAAVVPLGWDVYYTGSGFVVYGEVRSLALYDLTGKMLARTSLSQYLPAASLPRGLYILRAVGQDGQVLSRKVAVK